MRRLGFGLIACLVACLALAAGAAAQDYQQGLTAAQSGDYAAALRQWRPLAEKGHALAQYNVGLMYRYGRGVGRDYAKALKWYRAAAAQNHAAAEHNIGFMHRYGLGVARDTAKAIIWYRKAAARGYAAAHDDLGVLFASGRGVMRDYVQAYKWFSLAMAFGSNKGARNRRYLGQKMTPAQIDDARRLAGEWMTAYRKRRNKP